MLNTCVAFYPIIQRMSPISKLFVSFLIGFPVYQVIISGMMLRNRIYYERLQREIVDREILNQDLIAMGARQVPECNELTDIIENLTSPTRHFLYYNDMTLDESKKYLEAMDQNYNNMLNLSPLDQVMKIFSE